jgi:hypothetical protein
VLESSEYNFYCTKETKVLIFNRVLSRTQTNKKIGISQLYSFDYDWTKCRTSFCNLNIEQYRIYFKVPISVLISIAVGFIQELHIDTLRPSDFLQISSRLLKYVVVMLFYFLWCVDILLKTCYSYIIFVLCTVGLKLS